MKWLLLSFVLVAGLGILSSCTEDTVSISQDEIAPSTAVLFPISTVDNRLDIADSTDVYIKAADEVGITKVEIWISPESEDPPEVVATVAEPLPLSQIPDSLQQDDGSSVYATQWLTGFIQNGTVVRLYSRAYDQAGNSTRSELMVLRVMNEGVPRTPPTPEFEWTPVQGTVEDVFLFDASLTTDDVDDLDQIHVRWDFDASDDIWDLDWSPSLLASTPVEHRYTFARTYTVKLEARNSYLPNRTGIKERAIEVTNVGGATRPPEPLEMILIPAGAYPVGTADTTLAEASQNEYPLHQALLTVGFHIRRTEVPNRLYVEFLQNEMSQTDPRIIRDEQNRNEIYLQASGDPGSEPSLLVDLLRSAMFWNSGTQAVDVEEAARDLPVVGVTWYGAKAYAERFGMRLPTEHEWEIAAKGGHVDHLYPWGLTISPSQANYDYGDSSPNEPQPIGSYPEALSPFGLLDVVGNVKEWTKDWYGPYEEGQLVNPTGPIEPADGILRIVRGGGYRTSASGARVSARQAAPPLTVSGEIGFRTAFTDTLVAR